LKAETKKLKKDLKSSRKKPSSADSAADTADSGQLLSANCESCDILIQVKLLCLHVLLTVYLLHYIYERFLHKFIYLAEFF